MKLFVATILIICAIVGLMEKASSAEQRITLEQLQQMFEGMRTKTRWNLDGPMLWGYFFTDPDPRKLESVADDLVKDGYRLVKIYPTNDNKKYFLRVEKVERHTPESLDQRNQELYPLAERRHLLSYDGMDVGPAS